MIVGRERAEDFEVAGELFTDLAEKRGRGLLVGFDFAAGEFPFEAEVLVGRALGDEHAAVDVDDERANDGDGVGEGGVQGAGMKDGKGAGWRCRITVRPSNATGDFCNFEGEGGFWRA